MVDVFGLYVPVYESSAFYTFEIYKYLCGETSNKLPLQTKRAHLTGWQKRHHVDKGGMQFHTQFSFSVFDILTNVATGDQ